MTLKRPSSHGRSAASPSTISAVPAVMRSARALSSHVNLDLRSVEADHVAHVPGVLDEEPARATADVEQLVVSLEVELGGPWNGSGCPS